MSDNVNLLADVRELDRKLKQLPDKVRKTGGRKATRAAAKIVLEDAKRLVPYDTGLLESSLKVRARKRSRKNKNTVGHAVVTGEGFFKGETFYGGFLELGTKHIDADPYLRPAIYGNQNRIREEWSRVLREWFHTEGVK